jgi:erythromycin esterase
MKNVMLFIVLFITLSQKSTILSQTKFSLDDLLNRSTPITFSTSNDFREFKFLKEKIDTSVPIFLGESSHTIGDYNQLRVRMIQYLHEQLNYNVIAFEAPFANLKYVSENRNTLTAEKMLKLGLFYCWKTNDLLELMKYIQSHPKLKIMGFDCQDRNIDSLVVYDYKQKIERKNAALGNEYLLLIEQFSLLMKINPFENHEVFKSESKCVINQIDSFISKLTNSEIIDFDIHFHITNLKNNCINFSLLKPNFSKSNVFRDSIMAENYLMLTKNLYPSEKVIVWGHNAHLSKQSLVTEYPISMGEFLHRKLNYNSIGLFAYSGTYGYGWTYKELKKIKKPSKKFIEFYLHKNNLEISYIDLQNLPRYSWIKNNYKILDTKHGVMKTTPNKCFDGIIFFKHVGESKYLNNL